MKPFIHPSMRRTTRRMLPGHGAVSPSTGRTPLPGVDRIERMARRSGWTNFRAKQRFQYGLGSAAGLAGAALVLIMMFFMAMGPRANVLDTTADARLSQTPSMQPASAEVDPAEPVLPI